MTEMTLTEPAAAGPSARSGYLPIADHGIIGDLHSVALVGTEGTIDWYCPQRFDAPSVFGSLLDKDKGGFYRIAPAGDDWTSTQFYFPDTNVLVTRFLSPSGVAEVIDFMAIGHTTAEEHRHRLVRRVLGIKGEIRFCVEVEPRFDYARATHETAVDEHGAVFTTADLSLGLFAPVPVERTERGVRAEVTVSPEESASFVLEIADGDRGQAACSEAVARDLFV